MQRIYIATHDEKLNQEGWKTREEAMEFVLSRMDKEKITERGDMRVVYLDEKGREHEWLIYCVEVEGI